MIETKVGVGVSTPTVAGSSRLDDDGAFSVREFCERYNIGLTAFYAEVKNGRLTVKKRGSRTLVPRAAARSWFAALPNSDPANGASELPAA